MPATPKINYFESRHGYFTQYKKRQRLLAHGPNISADNREFEPAGVTEAF
jgi:hypothetical protein